MAIGAKTNLNELEKVTTNRKNIIKSPSSEESKVLGKKIMTIIVKGNGLSRLAIKRQSLGQQFIFGNYLLQPALLHLFYLNYSLCLVRVELFNFDCLFFRSSCPLCDAFAYFCHRLVPTSKT